MRTIPLVLCIVLVSALGVTFATGTAAACSSDHVVDVFGENGGTCACVNVVVQSCTYVPPSD